MTLYTDNKAAVRAAMQRSSRKLAASDLAAKPPKVVKPRRSRDERQRRLSLIERVRAAWNALRDRRQQQEKELSRGR